MNPSCKAVSADAQVILKTFAPIELHIRFLRDKDEQ